MSSVRWIDTFNEYNKTCDIYRTIIITKNKEDVYNSLLKEEYDVFNKSDDFNQFIEEQRRIMIITIEDFRNYSLDTLYLIRGEHNFMIIDSEWSEEVLNTLKNVNNTTLKENYYIWII
jgi:hypothetical protein